MKKQKLLVIKSNYPSRDRRITFFATYLGKKKKWNVGKELFDLIVKLEKLQ